MAIMIPEELSTDVKSPGERELFKMFQESECTRDWYVIHGLHLARHVSQIKGEIDFVVIVPNQAVLCLEVKGSETIRRERTKWIFGHEAEQQGKDPFRQAEDNMYSLKNYLKDNLPGSSERIFGYGVFFTRVHRNGLGASAQIDWLDWQLVDGAQLHSEELRSILLKLSAQWKKELDRRKDHVRVPDLDWSRECVKLLGGDLELNCSPELREQIRNKDLIKFTKEQYVALNAMERNDRVIFEGPAGTGKTFLAMEAARRARSQGRKTLLVCFNKALGFEFTRKMQEHAPLVKSCNFHTLLTEIAHVTPEEIESLGTGAAVSKFWDEDLPIRAIEALDNEKIAKEYHYDELIIDEAQDLMQSWFLECFNKLLEGGLVGGRWRIFGDFKNQDIFRRNNKRPEAILAEFLGGVQAPVYGLSTNCRNIRDVATYASRIMGGCLYNEIRRTEPGTAPIVIYYGNTAEERKAIIKAIEDLEREGYKGQSIAVLSVNSKKNILASLDEKCLSMKTRRIEEYDKGSDGILLGTVGKFKGMEAPAIIITDLEDISSEKMKSLLYIGVTRSLEKVVLMAHKSLRSKLKEYEI